MFAGAHVVGTYGHRKDILKLEFMYKEVNRQSSRAGSQRKH